MEKITISGEITVQFRDTTCIVEETGAGLVALTPSEALQLATALYAKYAEWKPIDEHDGLNPMWIKEADGNIEVSRYSMREDGYLACNGRVMHPTHYTEILKPNV